MLNPTHKYQIFPFLFCEVTSDSSCELKSVIYAAWTPLK